MSFSAGAKETRWRLPSATPSRGVAFTNTILDTPEPLRNDKRIMEVKEKRRLIFFAHCQVVDRYR